jgi:hypothetical protein
VTIDEEVTGARKLHVRVQPMLQGDGRVLAESQWEVVLPVDGGPKGPVKLVKRLSSTTRLHPGQSVSVAEVDLASWGGKGTVRFWLRADLLSDGGRAAYGPLGERIGDEVLSSNGTAFINVEHLAMALDADYDFDPAAGTFRIRRRESGPARSGQAREPATAGPFQLVVGSAAVSRRVRSALVDQRTGELSASGGGSPWVPLEDVARILGGKVRFDPSTDSYRIVGGRPVSTLMPAANLQR